MERTAENCSESTSEADPLCRTLSLSTFGVDTIHSAAIEISQLLTHQVNEDTPQWPRLIKILISSHDTYSDSLGHE
jgi:hypothetical protein